MNSYYDETEDECESQEGFSYSDLVGVAAQFPTSSSRDEPISLSPRVPSTSTSRCSPPPAPAPAPTPSASKQDDFPPLYEVSPGVLSDGRITANHPYVVEYLDYVSRVGRDATAFLTSDAGKGKGKMSEAVKESVAEALGIETLTPFESTMVYTLAALEVIHRPLCQAHFPFWHWDGEAAATAEIVYAVTYSEPSPVVSRITWTGTPEELYTLRRMQQNYWKREKKPAAKMDLRARKGTTQEQDATRGTSSTTPPKRTKSSAKGKGKAKAGPAPAPQEVAEVKDTAPPPAKRARKAKAVPSPVPTPTPSPEEPAQTRRSARVTRPTEKALALPPAARAKSTATTSAPSTTPAPSASTSAITTPPSPSLPLPTTVEAKRERMATPALPQVPEDIEVDIEAEEPAPAPAPLPTRRSKRTAAAAAAAALPVPTPAATRARSTSSAKSAESAASGSSTAVSDQSTVVADEAEAVEEKATKRKAGKRKADELEADAEPADAKRAKTAKGPTKKAAPRPKKSAAKSRSRAKKA